MIAIRGFLVFINFIFSQNVVPVCQCPCHDTINVKQTHTLHFVVSKYVLLRIDLTVLLDFRLRAAYKLKGRGESDAADSIITAREEYYKC